MSIPEPKFKYLEATKKFLEIAYPLATGPNKFKSKFGRILEGVFRKDYFTLQTIVNLTDLTLKDEGVKVVFGGSVLDLSRRVLEDMIYMMYIKTKDPVSYSEQFIKFATVERKQDLDFLRNAKVPIDEEKHKYIDEDYAKVPKRLKERRNWSGQSVEDILLWLVAEKKIAESEKETILRLYILGNRKNHTSSGDILKHNFSETLIGSAGLDIEVGLMITYGSALRVALYLLDETETSKEVASPIKNLWEELRRQP